MSCKETNSKYSTRANHDIGIHLEKIHKKKPDIIDSEEQYNESLRKLRKLIKK